MAFLPQLPQLHGDSAQTASQTTIVNSNVIVDVGSDADWLRLLMMNWLFEFLGELSDAFSSHHIINHVLEFADYGAWVQNEYPEVIRFAMGSMSSQVTVLSFGSFGCETSYWTRTRRLQRGSEYPRPITLSNALSRIRPQIDIKLNIPHLLRDVLETLCDGIHAKVCVSVLFVNKNCFCIRLWCFCSVRQTSTSPRACN